MTSSQEERPEIQRILIGLDASRHSLAALQAAAELASVLGADLHGLFVEDVNLLRVAELPGALELPFPFEAHARLSPTRMRRQLRAQAEMARRSLSSLARREEIEWSFQVVRGNVSSRVLDEASNADLLCVGTASRPVMRQGDVGSTAQAAATRASRSVLLISRDRHIHAPIAVVYDGSADAEPALRLAARLAQNMGDLLSVLVPADGPLRTNDIQAHIAEDLDAEELVIRHRELAGSGVKSLIHAVQTEDTGLLVLSAGLLLPDRAPELLRETDCPLLVVR